MRVALVSDTHGNAFGFEAVLSDIRERGVDRIVHLGDVSAFGPHPVECAEALKDLGCPVVMGNTDHYLFRAAPEGAPPQVADQIAWGQEQLAGFEEFLSGFVPVHPEGEGLLCCHGSPRSFDDFILPTTPDQEVAGHIEGVSAAVVAGGHTHQPMVRHLAGGRLFVNPGSAGLPFRLPGRGTLDVAEYAIVEGLDVEIRHVSFNLARVYSDAQARGLPHPERWAPA